MTARPKLHVVQPDEFERVFGSPRFIALSRKPGLASPRRFEPTRKAEGDVVI